MPERAKIVTNGDSQAVELPDSCRFPEGELEVLVHREGKKVVLESVEPADSVNGWPPEFLAIIGSWKEEIPRPKSEPISKAKNPFQ
jgi:virulence-associated protein VagC